MATGAKLNGRAEMQAKLQSVARQYPDRVGKALLAELKIELVEVVKRTPKESGDLRDSEKVLGPIQEGKSLIGLIVAGGPDAPYATIVHEDLEAFHKVGQAKYIESVLLESRAFIGARIAKRLNIAEWVG